MLHFDCKNCGAALTVDSGHRTTECPYCTSPQVVERPPAADLPNPHFALGFSLAPDPAKKLARRWLKGRSIFTVSGVRSATIDNMKGIYLPVYLYSATAQTRYAADIGENYQETEHYYTRDANGKQVRRTRTVTKTEWRHLEGARAEYVSDVVVTASRGVPNQELEAVEPYDLRALHRYTPALISGWIAEEPSLAFDNCINQARREALGVVGQKLTRFLPGNSQRNIRHDTRFQQESLISVLVPLWVLALRFSEKKPPFRLLINGQTGRAFGKAPLSWVKIGVTVGFGLLSLLAVVLVFMLAAYVSG